MIAGFRREVDSCALLGCYAASGGNCLPTFRDSLSVTSSGVNNPTKKITLTVNRSLFIYVIISDTVRNSVYKSSTIE